MRKQRGDLYTFGFATVVCVFCSVVLALAATALKPAQSTNARLDIVENVLVVAGYEQAAIKKMKPAEVLDLFRKNFKPIILNARDEEVPRKALEDQLAQGLNYPRADLEKLFTFELLNLFTSKKGLLANRAGKSLKDFDPGYKSLIVYNKDDKPAAYIVPIQGYGLWDMMYGYIALEPDLNTVRGITFYEHKETPGLGGEVEKPKFRAQYKGKTIFDKQGQFVSVLIAKGKATDTHKGDELNHYVDGISGATLTSKGVNEFIKQDVGEFVGYFKKLRADGSSKAEGSKAQTGRNGDPKPVQANRKAGGKS